MRHRLLWSVPFAASALLVPGISLASNQGGLPGAEDLSLYGSPASYSTTDASAGLETSEVTGRPMFLDAAEAEKPNVHGFIELPFKNSYVTPRGLVVENSGVVFQPVGGIVIPIGDAGPVKNVAAVAGIWNSVNTNQGDPKVGAWNEMDLFVSFSGDVDKFSGTLTYGAWNFPNSTLNKPATEHNIDLKVVYNDSDWWGGNFALKPYFDFFWAVSGSSTVVLGKTGGTYYFELGISPSYTYKEIANYPVTLTFPIYTSVGPAGYWDATESSGNWGLVSGGVNLSVPLSFIPSRYGFWHADAGLTYYYLINDALLEAGTILSGNTDRNVVQGSIGIGVNF
jgi:hypothetical protein